MVQKVVTVDVKLDEGQMSRIVRMVANEVQRRAELALLNRNAELEDRIDQVLALCSNSDASGRLIHPDQIRDLLKEKTDADHA